VQPETVEWLWASRIPRRKVTLLVGDPGTGKSFASLAISASVTNGTPLPGGEARAPQSVLVWNGEDGTADTIRPRAEGCGANVERIHVIDGEIDEATGKKSPFGLHSLDKIEEYIAKSGEDFGMVTIDPLSALMAGTDTHRDADVRSALQPLADFARRSDAAVLLVAHLTKQQAERALYRAGGSIGFVGLARSVLLAAIDPEDGRRAIAPLKCNLAAMPSPILYRIDEQGRFWWGQSADDLTADHLLRPVKYGGARQNAKDCIRELLGDGPTAASDFEARVKERGFAIATVKRARRDLGVIAEKQREKWFVRLP
jgi:putative DNA primase/helicase